ncbi:hypothetical protein YTPLAS73_06420 [Nitrosarchaeum sp.]|nr:hypothetical protein YTPLAS73_06420 [Nitrosarchaeum sp.]
MPKAGSYEYPARDLDDCIKYLQKAHETSQSLNTKRETFGKDIGLSSKGGGFGVLIGSMAMYGLIETGYGDIRYTDLAEKILFGKTEEQIEGKNKAVRNVKLFDDIFERYGTDPTTDQLRHILREKANVPISMEAKIAQDVGNSFKKNVPHFKIGGEPNKMQSMKSVERGAGIFTVTSDGLTIEVDSLLKLGMVEQLIKDARTQLENSSSHIKEKDSGETT